MYKLTNTSLKTKFNTCSTEEREKEMVLSLEAQTNIVNESQFHIEKALGTKRPNDSTIASRNNLLTNTDSKSTFASFKKSNKTPKLTAKKDLIAVIKNIN